MKRSLERKVKKTKAAAFVERCRDNQHYFFQIAEPSMPSSQQMGAIGYQFALAARGPRFICQKCGRVIDLTS